MTAYHRCRRNDCVPRKLRPALACGVFAVLGLSCGPRHGSATPDEAICSERLPSVAIELSPASASEPPLSQISVDVIAKPKAVAREIERQVPTILADVRRQPVGAPGEASYRVRRGPFGVALQGERLFVTTAVVADIEVCKPFGGLCIRYGTCNPELAAAVSIPAALGRDYSIGRARASINLTRPCYILGNDVSGPIRDAARDQIAQVERRVNGALPDLRTPLSQAWQLLQLPLALGPGTCIRVEPERLIQEKPRTSDGAITTRIGVVGRVGVERPCSTEPTQEPLRSLPELEQVAEATPGVILRVPIRIGWSDVSAELSRSLGSRAGSPAPVRILRARARGSSRNGKGVVALETTLEGPVCGDVAWLAEPWYDPATSRVRLRGVALAPRQERLAELIDDYALERTIEKQAALALPVDVSGAPVALRDWVRRAAAGRAGPIEDRFEMQPPRIDSVLPETDALIPIATLVGTAAVELK
jgi:hypothetical protein